MRVCLICGDDISHKRSDAMYCSKACKTKSKRKPRAVTHCLWCKELIADTAGPTAEYCDRKCRDAQYRVTYAPQRKEGIARWREENADHVKEYAATYYEENREQIAEYNKARYHADPERSKVWSNNWRINNLPRVREYYQERYWADPEHYRALSAAYLKANPAVRSQRQRLRQKRMQESPDTIKFSQAEWNAVVARFGGRCVYCGEVPSESLTMDHVVPLSRGGRHALANIVPACRSCNSSKHNRYLAEWKHSGLAPTGAFLI